MSYFEIIVFILWLPFLFLILLNIVYKIGRM